MWSFDRRRFLGLGAAALLPGCGFQPIFADGGAARAVSGQVFVAQIAGPLGFEMRRRLTERLGHGETAPFRLNVTVTTAAAELAITPLAEITRFNVTGRARFTLRGPSGTVASGNLRAFAAYSANDEPVATRAAERDAELRLAQALADQVTTRLLATAGDWLP